MLQSSILDYFADAFKHKGKYSTVLFWLNWTILDTHLHIVTNMGRVGASGGAMGGTCTIIPIFHQTFFYMYLVRSIANSTKH